MEHVMGPVLKYKTGLSLSQSVLVLVILLTVGVSNNTSSFSFFLGKKLKTPALYLLSDYTEETTFI